MPSDEGALHADADSEGTGGGGEGYGGSEGRVQLSPCRRTHPAFRIDRQRVAAARDERGRHLARVEAHTQQLAEHTRGVLVFALIRAELARIAVAEGEAYRREWHLEQTTSPQPGNEIGW